MISKSKFTSSNKSTGIQHIQPIYTSNANTNQADILLQKNIPSCRNQDRTADSAETTSAGTVMMISAKMNNKREREVTE
jgi:hypothetical protein